MMKFPSIDPILLQIGPLPIRWYSLAYIAGIVLGVLYIKFLSKKSKTNLGKDFLDDFILYAVIGIIIGGRLGYVLLYGLNKYIHNPLAIFKTWEGGMSFHGGLVGFLIAMILLGKSKKISHWKILDLSACAAPIGIFFGRIANFINGELFGRVSDIHWGMVFPYGGPLPRHPSQIYEALSEGLLLFIIMNVLFFKFHMFKTERRLSAMFAILYSFFRIIVEFFREPDASIGYIFGYLTMGQLVSFAIMLVGISMLKLTRD
jgi:phosphatidylglycerol---prolipoprotein diacylglyceryl transferase